MWHRFRNGYGRSPDSLLWRIAPPTVKPDAAFGNRPDVMAADIPGSGKVSARAIARMYAALLGEVGGVRLVTPERLEGLTRVAYSGPDDLFGGPVSRSLGLSRGRPGGGQDTWFGWSGGGGSHAGMDAATGTTLAITKHRLGAGFETAARIASLLD